MGSREDTVQVPKSLAGKKLSRSEYIHASIPCFDSLYFGTDIGASLGLNRVKIVAALRAPLDPGSSIRSSVKYVVYTPALSLGFDGRPNAD